MINIQDFEFKTLRRSRKVNGEDTIEFITFPTGTNNDEFDLIVEEASVNAFDKNYIIKVLNEKSIGKSSIKQATAIHDFYVNLINKQQPKIHNGSITFQNYMEMVFEGTGYTFIAIDQFHARSFENLGDDNRLALLSKGVERFQAEFELVGNQVRFKKQIGRDSDFQFRYGHNIKAISVDIDTKNLATKIEGTGDPELDIKESYTSPNVAIFGEIDAPPVRDERFKSNEALLEEMLARLQDTPELTLTIDFVDLRAAGYPYTVPNEGDRVFVIYEPMNDLIIETRIMEITEELDADLKPIKTEVTLSNHKKTFAGSMLENVQKQLSDIVTDDGVIKYNALDEAVKIATKAIQNAQTELQFPDSGGIHAVEKTDPNRFVALVSSGLGITKDGGNTFTEAITADGFVLSAGAIGRLSANHIQIGPDTEYLPGYDPSLISADLDEFEDYVNESFKDGIIEESEAKAIEKYLNTLDAEHDSLQAQVNSVLSSSYYQGDIRTQYADYLHATQRLYSSIEAAIENGKVSPEEKAEIDLLFEQYRIDLISLTEAIASANDEITSNKVNEADTTLRENLNLAAPLPTSISLDNYGITANTSVANRYARLDYRGLYIAGGAIQIDGGLPDDQIEGSSKWNRQGTYIDQDGIYTGKVEAEQLVAGTITESGSRRVDIRGGRVYSYYNGQLAMSWGGYRQEFYARDGSEIGYFGPNNIDDNPSVQGLAIVTQKDYISISSFRDGFNRPTFRSLYNDGVTMVAGAYNILTAGSRLALYANSRLVWDDTPSRDIDQPTIILNQGSDSNDNLQYFGGYNRRSGAVWEIRYNQSATSSVRRLRVNSGGTRVSQMLMIGEENIRVVPFADAVRWQYNASNYIQMGPSGQVDFRMGGSWVHSLYADGRKAGGSIKIDRVNYGMSPIDSPQILLEYIEFDIVLSPFGTKVFVDDKFTKAVNGFAVFPNNGEITSKGEKYFVIEGEGIADVRIVGKRRGSESDFWADMENRDELTEEIIPEVPKEEEDGVVQTGGL